jgi:signal peptide peptidase SppA
MYLPHLASRLYGMPLLLARSKLDIILSVLGERIGWQQCSPESSISPPSSKFARTDGLRLLNSQQDLSSPASGIAVIGITGSLMRRNIGIDAQSGLMSYAEIGQSLEMAAADPSVSGILLDIDSPGGEAGGVFELAERIREINATKPVWALACDSAFSAAYALACAASRVLVTQTSGLGSIGVIAMHVDQTARDAQQGFRFTAVTAGDFKGDLSPHEPLNKGATARLQTEVDRLYGLFVDHVASMRAMTPKAVRATQAACFFGPESIELGLADALVRSDQVIPEFAAFLANRSMHGLLRASTQVISSSLRTIPIVESGATDLPIEPTDHTTVPIFNVNPKEILMSQDLQPQPKVSSESPPATPLTPAPAPGPATAPDGPTVQVNHVDSEAVPKNDQNQPDVPDPGTAIATNDRAQALEIAQLCQLAGQSSRIASFLAQGISASQVRQALLLSRAQTEEIASLIHPDAAMPQAKTTNEGTNTLLTAVKKLSGMP